MNEREQLMGKFRSLRFAQVDLGLFLDSHPDDPEALATYRELMREAEAVKKKYAASYGPLTPGAGSSGDYWDWVATPFPWESC